MQAPQEVHTARSQLESSHSTSWSSRENALEAAQAQQVAVRSLPHATTCDAGTSTSPAILPLDGPSPARLHEADYDALLPACRITPMHPPHTCHRSGCSLMRCPAMHGVPTTLTPTFLQEALAALLSQNTTDLSMLGMLASTAKPQLLSGRVTPPADSVPRVSVIRVGHLEIRVKLEIEIQTGSL